MTLQFQISLRECASQEYKAVTIQRLSVMQPNKAAEVSLRGSVNCSPKYICDIERIIIQIYIFVKCVKNMLKKSDQ